MDSNKEKTIGEIRALEKNLMRLHTLEELEASPELLNELPEPERSMFLERRRALRDFVAENQQAMDALREELRETTATYNRIIQQATEITGRPKEEIEELLVNDPEVNSISFGDFVALSITDDEKLALDGLLATIIKKSREENRTAREIAQDLQEALESQTALVSFAWHGAVEATLLTSKKKAEIINGTAVISAPNDVRILVNEFDKLKGALSIGADKVLHVALMEFSRINNVSGKDPEIRSRRVTIPLKEYAALLKYDVKERHTTTSEEAQAEKKRVKMQLDNARRKIAKDIDVLYHISLEYYEDDGKFQKVRLLTSSGFENGMFEIAFSPEIADALAHSPVISQYDTKLLGLDERHPNAYKIMRKMLEYYNQTGNQRRNQNNRLKVETILKVTDLPSYEKVQATTRGHWQERIKEPLEENLEYLVKEGLLKEWKYTHSKGRDLTDQEVIEITKYEDFTKLLIEFEPVNKKDQSKRIAKKEEEDKKRKAAIMKEEAKIAAKKSAKKKKQ